MNSIQTVEAGFEPATPEGLVLKTSAIPDYATRPKKYAIIEMIARKSQNHTLFYQ